MSVRAMPGCTLVPSRFDRMLFCAGTARRCRRKKNGPISLPGVAMHAPASPAARSLGEPPRPGVDGRPATVDAPQPNARRASTHENSQDPATGQVLGNFLGWSGFMGLGWPE